MRDLEALAGPLIRRAASALPAVGLLLATLLLPLLLPRVGDAAPILRRHDRPDARYRQLARELPPVADVADAAGTLIAPRWILTAAHVAEELPKIGQLFRAPSVRLAGRRIVVAEVVLHPGWPDAGCDIALLRLAEPATSEESGRAESRGEAAATARPVPICRQQDEQGRRAFFVGRGGSGDGRTGPILFDRRLRAAANRIEKSEGAWLLFRFDPPPGGEELEGISGPGDSGGPALIERDDGSLCVAGVSSWQDNRAQRRVEGVYGVWEHYARVSAYADWIDRVTGGAGGDPASGGNGER